MPLQIVATRFPTEPNSLDEVAGTLNSVHSALASNLDQWDSTEVLVDEERSDVWLLARWSEARAAEEFAKSRSYRALLERIEPELTGEPETKRMRAMRTRRANADMETDIAISGGLG